VSVLKLGKLGQAAEGGVVLTSTRRTSVAQSGLLAARPVLDRRSSHTGVLGARGMAGDRGR
jgi:hypothetical protein